MTFCDFILYKKSTVLSGSDVNKTNDHYSTPLHLAAITGDLNMVKVCIFSFVIFLHTHKWYKLI